MANNAFEKMELENMSKGFWLMYDNQAKAKKETSVLDKLAAEIRAKDEARDQARREQLQKPRHSSGIIKAWKDWHNSYYHK